MTKRILIVTQNFYPEIGSGANRMKNVYKLLSDNGYKVHVLTTVPSYPNSKMYETKEFFDDEYINKKPDYEIIRLKMRHEKHKNCFKSRIYYYLEFMMKVHYFINRSHHYFDYIYATSPNILVPWGAFFLQPSMSSKKILEIRDLWPDSIAAIDEINIKGLMPVLKMLEKQMYKISDKIIVNNESFINHINQISKKGLSIEYIPNSIRKNEINIEDKFENFSVVYTGNVGFAQDVQSLMKIAEKLNEQQIYLNLIIYGTNAPKLKAFIKEKQFTYIRCYPPVTKQECSAFVSRHHIALSLLEDKEVFLNVLPGKVIDALCVNVPVVTNLGGVSNQLINNNLAGYAKERATPTELVKVITDYKTNEELLKQHSKNAEKLKNKLFVWDHNIFKLINFIEK